MGQKSIFAKYFDLSEKVAVVTGGAGMLGGEYVRALLDAGASVVVFDMDLNNPRGNLKELKSERLLLVEADITDRKSVIKGHADVMYRFGHPDVLINNAAIDFPPEASDHTGFFEDYPESSWQKVVDTNLKGMLICCQIIGGDMARNRGGSIINVSSIYGILSPDQRIYQYEAEWRPYFKPVSYCVTKAGVLNLTRYLATYWASRNVRVNTLTLGGVFNDQDMAFVRNYSGKVPLGRMARKDEYNGAILFLASDASSYMTGSNLIIDGGYSCW